MKFLKKMIKNWLNSLDEEPKVATWPVPGRGEPRLGDQTAHDVRALNFRVYVVPGGKVVETTKYDRMKDQLNAGLYIITEQQNLGQELERIITMECLK